VVCLYAVYHLVRNAKSRPPGSSASYHFFALVTDGGFIPFYIFTVLLSRRNSDMEAGTIGRWRTMFPTDEETNKVLTTTWLTSIANAGLHLLSLFLDLYLLIVFRKISNLPPDMNPLEDNLTSRRKTKQKHKNSSISAITPLTGDNEKRFSNQSSVPSERFSQNDPLLAGDIPSPSKHQVAFMHTRTNSDMTYSPHTPQSARQSKERFSMYSQPQSTRQSKRTLNHRDDLLRRDDDDDNETLAQRKSMLAQQANIKRHSRPESYISKSDKEQLFYTPPGTAQSGKQDHAGDLSLQRNSRETLQDDNWFVHPDDNKEPKYEQQQQQQQAQQPYTQPYEQQEEQYLAPVPKQTMFNTNNNFSMGYNTLSPYDDVSDVEDQTMAPQPLRMNPPTPPPAATVYEKKITPPVTPKRTYATTSISTEETINRPDSRGGTPKSRKYGDLKAATSGIRSGNSAANSPNTSPTKGSFRKQPNHFPSATKQYVSNTPPAHSPVKNSPFSLDKKSYTSVRRTGDAAFIPVKGQSPRVVSRSGVDYMNPYEFDDSDLGTPGRRRDVSGKIAEEGRGGVGSSGWGGMTYRKISGIS
jgi:hypothetical protein